MRKKLLIPHYVEASFDAFVHKTEADIVWLVQHELDLFEEGEQNDIKTSACAVQAREFLRNHKQETDSITNNQ